MLPMIKAEKQKIPSLDQNLGNDDGVLQSTQLLLFVRSPGTRTSPAMLHEDYR